MARDTNMRLIPRLLLLLVVASLAMVSRSASVANQRCGETSEDERCDPTDTAANRACSTACHDSGCGGSRCVYEARGVVGVVRGCHCLP